MVHFLRKCTKKLWQYFKAQWPKWFIAHTNPSLVCLLNNFSNFITSSLSEAMIATYVVHIVKCISCIHLYTVNRISWLLPDTVLSRWGHWTQASKCANLSLQVPEFENYSGVRCHRKDMLKMKTTEVVRWGPVGDRSAWLFSQSLCKCPVLLYATVQDSHNMSEFMQT